MRLFATTVAVCALAALPALAAETITELDLKPLTELDLSLLDNGDTQQRADDREVGQTPAQLASSTWSIGGEASTLGLGAFVGYRVMPELGVRLVGNGLGYSGSETLGGVTYVKDTTLASGGVIADYYPAGQGFRVSGGLRYDANGASLSANPGAVTLGGQNFQAGEVGRLNGEISYNKIAPYVGIGFEGEITPGLSLVGEVGTLIQGGAKVKLDSTGGTLSGTAQMQQALEGEKQAIKHDLEATRFYPVVSVAVKYRF